MDGGTRIGFAELRIEVDNKEPQFPSTPTVTDFKSMLEQLGEQHDREIAVLQHEISYLQSQREAESQDCHHLLSKEPLSPTLSTGLFRQTSGRTSRGENTSYRPRSTWTSEAAVLSGVTMSQDLRSLRSPRRSSATQFDNVCVSQCWCLERLKSFFGLRGLIISPNSTWRFGWDTVCLFLIGLDLIWVPLQAFDLPSFWLAEMIDWVTLLFWTADMAQSFFLGYYHKGRVVTNHSKVIRRYLTTWFILDCIIVIPDWVLTCTKNNSGNDLVGAARIFRGARAFRVLRLVRVLKLRRIMSSMFELIESEYAFTMVNLIKLLLALFLLNHVIACVWYLLGTWSQDGGRPNWLDASFTTGKELDYQYLTSLHWSLTQFTPASMDVSARNAIERAFSILVLFFALVAFSSIVGSITASMTHLQNLRGDEMKQFWLLRRYLRQRQINKGLSIRIMKFLEYQSARQQDTIQEGSLTILQNLSGPLQNELVHDITAPVLVHHPFFKRLSEEMEVLMHRLVGAALRQCTVASMDILFDAGEEARRMYFVKSGDFEYRSRTSELLVPPLQPQECVAEAALWTNWRHLGSLQALSPSELIQVDAAKFGEEMLKHPSGWTISRSYAEDFLVRLNEMPTDALSDILRPSADNGFWSPPRSPVAADASGDTAELPSPTCNRTPTCNSVEEEELAPTPSQRHSVEAVRYNL